MDATPSLACSCSCRRALRRAEAGAYAATACVVIYLSSGHSGIYTAQRIGTRKHEPAAEDPSLTVSAKLHEEQQLHSPTPEA